MPKTKIKSAGKQLSLTLGQKKLATRNIQLPPFPLTTSGSMPKTTELQEMKYRVQTGFQQLSDLERKEKMAIEYWIREQEKMGFDVLVDGEINRGDMISHFAQKIAGFEKGGLVRCYGNRYFKKPVIRNKLEWKEPLTFESWRISQRSTHRPLKVILTGPYTLLEWSFNEYYSNKETALRDLVEIYKKEMALLQEGGARIIQIDEPAMSSRPAEFSLVSDSIKELTKGLSAYTILHHSYGNLEPIWPKMQRLNVDNFHLEMTNSNFSLFKLLKKFPTKKDITVGIIESHNHAIESPQKIADRIRYARKFLTAGQLWFSPDCGLKTRSMQETLKKLEALKKAVFKVRTTIK